MSTTLDVISVHLDPSARAQQDHANASSAIESPIVRLLFAQSCCRKVYAVGDLDGCAERFTVEERRREDRPRGVAPRLDGQRPNSGTASMLETTAKRKGCALLSYEPQPLPMKHVSAADVLRFRDEAWRTYFTNPASLSLVEITFGSAQRANVEDMAKIQPRRKPLEPEVRS